jgi:hypothetical protein
MKANRETVSEFQQFDAVMHKVLSDSRQVQMVEVYRKGDFKKRDRSKVARPEGCRVHPRYIFFADCELTDRSSGLRCDMGMCIMGEWQ